VSPKYRRVQRLPYFIGEVYNLKGPRSALGCRPLNEFEELLVIQPNKVVMCYVAKPSLALFVEKQEAGFTKMGSIKRGNNAAEHQYIFTRQRHSLCGNKGVGEGLLDKRH